MSITSRLPLVPLEFRLQRLIADPPDPTGIIHPALHLVIFLARVAYINLPLLLTTAAILDDLLDLAVMDTCPLVHLVTDLTLTACLDFHEAG